MTLSFHRTRDKDKKIIDNVFALFPRRGLNNLFGSIEGRAEHYCAFALPEHGSITFHCNLDDTLDKQLVRDYDKFMAILDNRNAVRVKAYYPLLHTLRSFGSDFCFKDTDLATCASIRKVFDSFLYMSKWIDLWGTHGALRLVESAGQVQQQQQEQQLQQEEQQQHQEKIDSSMFRKEISCLRVEASFVLNIPKKKLNSETVLAWIQSLLERDLNVLFGYGRDIRENSVLARTLSFLSVNDWLQQVRNVREMLICGKQQNKEGEIINFSLQPRWRSNTSRAKQQAECLQSLLGYCCQKANGSVRSRSWGLVWNANAEQEYPGMCHIHACFSSKELTF